MATLWWSLRSELCRSVAANGLVVLGVLFMASPDLRGQEQPAGAQERAAPDAAGMAFFEQKIRPVLVEHCYACHSADAQEAMKLKGNLYLDSAAGLLTGGDSGPALVKGDPDKSLIIEALKFDGLQMPPAGKLPAEVIADFETWVKRGAPDPRQGTTAAPKKREIDIAAGREWWAFQPLQPVIVPEVPAGMPTQGAIDRFILAAQRERGLTPNVPAAREKLIRRAYFDLIGLPPTPEQVAAFVQDTSPEAFARVVDALLESPHYGEKWARHWLDAARYAESGGYEFDGFRPGAYHYRDWVIQSLNRDLPYDAFVRLQLAGDKLLPDSYEGAAATGFLVAGPYPGQITAKTVERIRYDQLDDMLMTVGGAMMGLTLGCVRCHEHKYDPIPQQDYYGLAAALARTVHGSRPHDPDPEATAAAQARHEAEHQTLRAHLEKFAQDEMPKRLDTWRTADLPRQPDAPRWQVAEPVSFEAERSYLKLLPGGVLAHDGSLTPGSMVSRRGLRRAVPAAETYRIRIQTWQKNITALRLDAFTDKSLPQRGPGLNGDGSFQLAELKVSARPVDPNLQDPPLELKLKGVFAALEDPDQPLAHALDGKPDTAWVVRATARKDNAAVFELESPLAGFAGGTELMFEFTFRDLGLGRTRLSLSTEPNPATWAGDLMPQHLGELRALFAEYKNQLPPSALPAAARWFSPFDEETARAWKAVQEHAATEPRAPLTEVYTTITGGQDVYLLRRGEVDNKAGKAEPAFIQVLMRGEAAASAGQAEATASAAPAVSPAAAPADPRVELARWMTDVDRGAGPLLARVIANRIWQHHFGQGLVGTPNDFGAQGERPSHPELLEWLAGELVRGEWRLKPLHRQIMLSAAYQQSNAVSPENLKIDPENRSLWHYRPRRLDAEIIRDALLYVGGSLNPQMYGPSILDNTPRRSIYLRVKRSELIPLMSMFDAPEPTQSIGERVSTTVPTQALTMMNSPFVRQQAEKLARRITADKATPLPAAVDRGYQLVLSRPPSEAERSRMLAFIAKQVELLGGDAAAATDQAVIEFCHVLLCLNEFVYVD